MGSVPAMTAAVPVLDESSLLRVEVDGPAVAAFTTRHGGVSQEPYAALNLGGHVGDDPAAVLANRRGLCHLLGVDAGRVGWLTQVHGADVVEVRPEGPPSPRFGEHPDGAPEGDALVTSVTGLPLVVQVADCLPVLLWRRDTPRVAAVHAGWRGVVAGVLQNAVAALGEPGRVGAVIGPAVGPCCYPVSDYVRDVFTSRFGAGVAVGPAVDLPEAAHRALVAAGVPARAVTRTGVCTSCENGRFFSYRRAGGDCGRHAGVIWAVG